MIYRVDTILAQIFKPEHYWWKYNNYTNKLVIEILSQIIYDFFNIWRIKTHYLALHVMFWNKRVGKGNKALGGLKVI